MARSLACRENPNYPGVGRIGRAVVLVLGQCSSAKYFPTKFGRLDLNPGFLGSRRVRRSSSRFFFGNQFFWKNSVIFRHFHKTLPHGKCCYSAPQIARDTNDGDSESREQGLQARVSFVVAEYHRYVDYIR